MGLEEKIENSENSGFFDQIWKRKWLRRSVLPLAAATSIFFGAERTLHSATSKQSETLTHDPVLLIHGLDISPIRTLEDYADFDGVRKIEGRRVVDFDDFFLFAERYGTSKGDGKYDSGFDLTRDGRVDLEDFFKFTEYFGQKPKPLEETWDELSDALTKDLKWTDGRTVGEWVPSGDLKAADFYKLRLTSGDGLTFDKQGDEVKLAVDKISKLTGRNVILTGFSMGGLSARAYLQNNSNPKASALVTICTPHVGSYLAYLSERDSSKISEWESKNKSKGRWVKEVAELCTSVALKIKDKPAIKYLAPCADSLKILNNNLYKMPTNIPYVNVVSQVPNLEALEWYLELINKYVLDYGRCKDEETATPGLLAKGDGVVPTIGQLLSYAIINTNPQNSTWYEKVKGNITENSEMQVFHTEGNKQTGVLKKVLEEVIEKIENPQGEEPSLSKIAFVSNRDGNSEIYVMNSDGSSQQNLTNNPTANEEKPAWSPDGSKIAFVSYKDEGGDKLYVIDSDGHNLRDLTKELGRMGGAAVWGHSWSPDGRKIAFGFGVAPENVEKYLIDADGKNLKKLTDNLLDERLGPVWSPDGRYMVFGSFGASADDGMFIIDIIGNKTQRLTRSYAERRFPGDDPFSWSVDGTKVYFISGNEYNDSDIYSIDINNHNLENITKTHDTYESLASLLPNGRNIVFCLRKDLSENNKQDICVMDTNGNNLLNLTNSSIYNSHPKWSSDGKWIVFVSSLTSRGGNKNIYLINFEKNTQIRLTNNSVSDFDPVWSPK